MGSETKEVLLENDEPPSCGLDWNDWKWQLRNSVQNIDELRSLLSLKEEELENLRKVTEKYPLIATPYYLSLISKKDDPLDPIRMQCVPSQEEDKLYFDIQDDPLGEEEDSVVPGLVHRYPDRVLITLTDMCPVYCRHCTRKREWQKGKWTRKQEELEKIYDYIASRKEIRDVILSGGDPFILSTDKLESVLVRIKEIPHVEIIRIGTRCPVVLPQRIDSGLVNMLKKYRPIWVNTHFNHPNEITEQSKEACDRLLCAGIQVNNQSVLLKGINDSVEVMTKLCHGLLKIGVRPYYLFQCDPVSGTGHLRTSIEKGLEIIKGMRGFTSGLAVPNFIVDGINGQGKVPLQPDYIVSKEKGFFILKGYKGDEFKYYNPEE